MATETVNGIEFTEVKSDMYGNPRSVIHFMNFLTQAEKDSWGIDTRNYLFNLALKRSRKVGGEKYRGKSYGGGIVLQAWSKDFVANKINEIVKNAALQD